jgi:hypothetical protein
MTDLHPYARELAAKLGSGSKRQVSLKARTLLKGFGYYRRTATNVREIQAQLSALELECDFSLTYPAELDERIEIRRAQKGAAVLPTARPRDEADLLGKSVEATVEVFSQTGSGSGFIVHPDGLLVTARHVVNNEEGFSLRKVKVSLHPQLENEQTLEGTVFRSHKKLDFALVWLEGTGPFPAIPLGQPNQARYAQTVYAIGAPAGLPNTLSRGIISNPHSHFNGVDCLQTDAAIDHGNSGGPLVDESGAALAINLWGLGDYDAAKFSVPVDYLAGEIAAALKHSKEACLKALYCPVCGFCDYAEPTWYCRNCGVQWQAQEPPPLPPELEALVFEVLAAKGLNKADLASLVCVRMQLMQVEGCLGVASFTDGKFYLVANSPLLVMPGDVPSLGGADLQKLGAAVGEIPGAAFVLKPPAVFLTLCTEMEGLHAETAAKTLTDFQQVLAGLRDNLLKALK